MSDVRIELELDPELKAFLAAAKDLEAVDVVVGTDLVDPPYPEYLEYGTSRMPAHPSARPAWDESQGQVYGTTAAVLSRQFTRNRRIDQPDLEAAGMAGGEEFRNRWVQLAPVKTGTYRRSIHIEVELAR